MMEENYGNTFILRFKLEISACFIINIIIRYNNFTKQFIRTFSFYLDLVLEIKVYKLYKNYMLICKLYKKNCYNVVFENC